MSWPDISTLVPWLLWLATTGSLMLAAYAWTRRQQPGVGWLIVTLLIGAAWTSLDLINFLVDAGDLEITFKQATWWLILAAGYSLLRFSCIHARRERWWDVLRLPVSGLLLTNAVLMSTNRHHEWIWKANHWVEVGSGQVAWLEPGVAFYWIFQPAALVLPLAGILALVVSAVDLPAVYSRQIAAFAFGASLPVLVNLGSEATNHPGLDLTPATMAFAIVAFGVSAFRYQLLDVMPVARSLLLEQLDDGVVVLDNERRVVDVNPAAQRLLGARHWSPGQAAAELLPFWLQHRDTIESGGRGPAEIEVQNDGGRILEVGSSVVRNHDGSEAGRVLLLHDVSARARLVRELDSYAHAVAQDLKSPLVSLIDVLGDIDRRHEAVDASKHLHSAQRVCQQMRGTIEALLLFASLRSDDTIELTAIDMRSVVEASLHRLSEAIKARGAEVTIASEWPAAVTQAHWVEEIWTNYISNAVKYGGTPPIVELGAEPAGSGMRYWVRDNGPGLSPEQSQQLFAEFTRLDPQRAEGHGLGLSIVRRIAEKLGGAVGCDSSPGRGSTFWFTLPNVPLDKTQTVRVAEQTAAAPC